MSFTMPNTITNESTRDARPVQANFAAITAALQNDFVRRDGTVSMSGALTLPGAPTEGLHAATKSYVDTESIPVGVILDYGGDSAPGGWALGVGQLVGKAAYPILWSIFADKFGASTSTQFYLPDLRSAFVVGKGVAAWSDVVGEKGGSKDAVVVSHNHSTPNHTHSGTAASTGAHTHYSGHKASTHKYEAGGNAYSNVGLGTSVNTSSAGAHHHSVSISSGGGGTAGTSGVTGVDKNLPPYIVLNKIIRLG